MSSDSRKDRIRKHLLKSSNGSDFIPPSKMRKWPSRATNEPTSPNTEASLPETTEPEIDNNSESESPILSTQALKSSTVESQPSPVLPTQPTEEEMRQRKVQEHLRQCSDSMEGYFAKGDGKQKEKILSHLRQIFSQSR